MIYKKLVGNIGITNNFSTKIDKIDRVYDNFDSKYSRLVSNFMSCPKSVTSLTKPNNDFKISKFYLKCHNKEELWYTDISFIIIDFTFNSLNFSISTSLIFIFLLLRSR